MKVEITGYEPSRKFRKLLIKLIKTANKYSGFRGRKAEVDINFVTKDEIRSLNKKYLGKDKPTDVLSFPNFNFEPMKKLKLRAYKRDISPDSHLLMLGDIMVSSDVAKENAIKMDHSFEREVCHLVVHGFLHLIGFDHIKEKDRIIMQALEKMILKKYGIVEDVKKD